MLGYGPSLLLDAPPSAINRGWVGDITYVPLLSGEFINLAMLMICMRVASSAGNWQLPWLKPM